MTARRHSPDELGALLAGVRRSSWRWECQGYYAVDAAEVDAWRAGRDVEQTDDDRAWLAYIVRLRDTGVPFERVRMLTEPLTDYLRWMLDTTHINVAAGEDIRWIEQARARRLGMPDYDFYLLDDERVAFLRFDDAAELVGVDVDDDVDIVRTHQHWRERVWPLATRHDDYIAGAR